MRIALVNPEYPSVAGHGGIATYTYTLADALAAQGHRIHVLSRRGTQTGTLHPDITLHPFDFTPPPSFLRPFESIGTPGHIRWEKGHARAIRDTLIAIHRAEKLDCVEIPEFGGLAHALTGRLPFPVIINFHTPTELVDSLNRTPVTAKRQALYRFEDKALRHADGYRCPSEALKEIACSRYDLDSKKVTVIRNPLATGLFEKILDTYTREEPAVHLLFVGRLEIRKGIELVAGVLKKILAVDPRIVITFAGEYVIDGAVDYRQQIENTLSDEDRERVWFLGPVNRSDLTVLYCRSSMFLIPSLFENAPYSLLEAMAARLPIVGADAGGIGEILRHRQNGLLFPPGTPDAMVSCIADYVADPSLARSCAKRAYEDIKTIFAAETIAGESVAFYQSIMNRFSR